MNYEQMSDFEINKLVAEARGGFGGSTDNEYAPNEVICFDEKLFHTERDYCNDPTDAWPVILSNGISIEFDENANFQNAYKVHEEGYPEFEYGFEDLSCKNPLRAAMIVYLMMQEAE